MSRRVVVIGAGYVGLTTAACLSMLGHRVVCCEVDRGKVGRLARGEVRTREPDLRELVHSGLREGTLEFTAESGPAVSEADAVFLCLPTPMGEDGAADLSALESVVGQIGGSLRSGCVLVAKSTVPVGTSAWIASSVARSDVAVVSNPEFLREGSAVHDFLYPERIVVGAERTEAAEEVVALYERLHAPVVRTDRESAEMVKYAANCLLATKLSYVNAVAGLCEGAGADVAKVTEGMRHDPRVGDACLAVGPGWGGSCLPKDARALLRAGETVGFEFALLRASVEANERQRARMVSRVAEVCGSGPERCLEGVRLGLLGLVFKAGTDDLRDSPALAVARGLSRLGAELTAVDPGLRGDEAELAGITLVDNAYQAAKGTGGLVLLTEWSGFRELDWRRLGALLERPVVVDTRNHLDPEVVRRAGLRWCGVGRPG
ncbi:MULTISPECIES: UDP-glucose/GDP-mannose dehydrogenase family protein [unclassified Actinopolyspora]|uniref:UDP-glucose dehydrogenase family protein n=1 Tax=unclassified Actinopolyspora TaxID=2639451 RepID=UPI0013F6239B|nr:MULTISPECIES: UDP-glucose/GDP-mannose dehydrogenase family protein [unclassified Actinopolyspora]NHD15796.1 UDP-glucose/GDP-mannose dehydrogenase family protein [Actinopolyspora sp. BKK2]NHE74990.1 UDP-glucose/GDP-mannose dehydrogenase family protein [Actinopolyspora sp. BKK1]